MAIDLRHIGRVFGPHIVTIESGRLRLFAKATGQQDRVFFDDNAAFAAGYKAAVAPPTFAFCLEMDREDPFDMLTALDIDLGRVLHGEQSFCYHGILHSGDEVSITSRIADISCKRGGAMEIVRIETDVRAADGSLAVAMMKTLVVRAAG